MIIQNTKLNIQSPKFADNPHTYSSKAIGIKPPNHFVYCPPQMRLLSRLLDRLSVLGILLTGLIHNQTHTYYYMIYIYTPMQFDTNQSQMCALAVLGRCLSVVACGFSWLLWRPAMLLREWPCGSWGHGGSNHAMWIMGSGVASC